MEYKAEKKIDYLYENIEQINNFDEGRVLTCNDKDNLKKLYDYFMLITDSCDEIINTLNMIKRSVSVYHEEIKNYFQPIHMEKLILLCRKRELLNIVIDVIHDIMLIIPESLDILIQLNFFENIKCYVSENDIKTLINFLIDILSICDDEKKLIYVRNEIYFKLFPIFTNGINEGKQTYIEEYSRICFMMCHYGNYPNNFGDILSSILYSFLQSNNDYIIINGIQGMKQLLTNNYDISSFVFLQSYSETCIIEDLTLFLIHKNQNIQIASLRFLSKLFVYKDNVMKAMDYYGTLSEVRKIIKSEIKDLIYPSLQFFYNWCLNTNEYYSKLLDEISEINFVEICKNQSYTIKELMIRLLLSITENAIPYHIEKIFSSELIITMFEQISNLNEQYTEYFIKIIVNSANKCQNSAKFISILKEALSDEYLNANYQKYINAISSMIQ